MSTQASFGSMEHFLYENPTSRQLTSEEFIKAYDEWVFKLQAKIAGDSLISSWKEYCHYEDDLPF